MRAYQAKAPQGSRTCTKCGQSRRRWLGAGADQNILNSSAPGNNQADGAPNFVRKLRESFCRFSRKDFIDRHTPAIEPLKRGELAGAETENLSVNFWNGRRFLVAVG